MKKFILLTLLVMGLGSAFAQLILSPAVDSIPMRDGKKLAADLYHPAGCIQCPTLLIQTPYNRQFFRFGLPLGIRKAVDSLSYHVVVVDWRGFFGSAGAASDSAKGGEDGYDIVEWIAAQPWSDGKVGTWGPSALAKVQYQTAREKPPHLVCGVPLVGAPQFTYAEHYPGGVYRPEYMQQLDALGFGLSLIVLASPFYNFVWAIAENTTFFPNEIEVPMLLIGGWYDHNSDPMLAFFNGLQQQSPLAVRDQHKMLVGPWAHGGNSIARPGGLQQGQLTYPQAVDWQDSFAIAFLDYHLLGLQNGWDQTPALTYFQMGENQWRDLPAWTAFSDSSHLYLSEQHSLDFSGPPVADGSYTVDYDPRNPSPTYGGTTLRIDLVQGPYDQSDSIENRADALVFSSPTLSQALAIRGNIKLHLYLSSDRPDTDVAVRLTDVYPDGRSMLLTDKIQRMRFREGFRVQDTLLMTSGQVYPISIELVSLAHTFLAGHQIRLVITGSNYPKYHTNLNNGGPMYSAGDTLVAHNRIHMGPSYPSRMVLPTSISVGLAPSEPALSLQLFPQPARGAVQLRWEGGRIQFDLWDAQGRLLQSWEARGGKHTFSVAGLAAGIYYLKAQQGNRNGSKKVVVW